jgi:hypothetical protein
MHWHLFSLKWPKVTVQIVRSSSGLRSAIAAVRTLFVEGLMATRGAAFQPAGPPSANIARPSVSRERNRSEQESET